MNIRQVRKKIKSVGNVKKITKAMQLVSAIKMKKAQQLAQEGEPYRKDLDLIIHKLVSTVEEDISPLMSSHPSVSNKKLVILISSNKGLCGSFHFNLFRFALKNLQFKDTDFITVGAKAALLVSKTGGNIIADFSSSSALDSVSAIFQTAVNTYLEGVYGSVDLIYNVFVNTLNFQPTRISILPVSPKSVEEQVPETNKQYVVEPSAHTIVDALLRSFVEEEIRGSIINSEASEHSARMIAMKNATDNAEDVIYNLTLLRNKIRQEKITYELLDMVTAKESVEAT